MSKFDQLSRRDFLRHLTAAGIGVTTRAGALGLLTATQQAVSAVNDYRALVCVFLGGGNDGYNMLIPTDSKRYDIYKTSRANLALAVSDTLALAGGTSTLSYGLHEQATGLADLYNQGKLAFVANVGTLLQPTTKKDYEARKNLPEQLYSHSDQSDQAMTSDPQALERTGWGGKMADLLSTANTGVLPLGVSLSGANLLQLGDTAVPYYLNAYGVNDFDIISTDPTDLRTKTFNKLMALAAADTQLFRQTLAQSVQNSIALSNTLVSGLKNSNTGTVVWPSTWLGQQLQMVAKMISIRQTLGMGRQVFFVTHYGYDTHNNQLNAHGALMNELSNALSAFHASMEQQGVGNAVTSFTLSDFGRTLTSNGDGTDHAWGNVQLVAGGAVKGGQVYGKFPNQTIDGVDDAGYGRLIPTTSIEQYGATLARWFGVDDVGLQTVFPRLSLFPTANLGFMR